LIFKATNISAPLGLALVYIVAFVLTGTVHFIHTFLPVLINKAELPMNIPDKIKYHHDHKKYCKIRRELAGEPVESCTGYIVDYSAHFVLVQEVSDFEVRGYMAFPVQDILNIRCNNNDKYYDKIMQWEGLKDKIENKHTIDLSSWANILQCIKKAGFNVILQNEAPSDRSFDIGPVTKITKTSVYIRYFNAAGLLNDEPSKIGLNQISIVKFDDRYINIFSKYLRTRKPKKS
jgi:hypothetical protein